LSRTLEAGGRQAGEKLLEALIPALSDREVPGGVEALISTYRQYLGEMANMLPAVARYLTGQMQPTAGASKVLFQLSDDATMAAVRRRSARESYQGQATYAYTTPATLKKITQDIDARLPGRHAAPASLLKQLADMLTHSNVIDITTWLDELKYDLRRHGLGALPEIRRELRPLLDSRLDQYCITASSLQTSLGEKVLRRIVRDGLLEHYLEPLRSSEPYASDGPMITPYVLERLQRQFRDVGIRLSDRISGFAGRDDGVIFDHENDAAYEVRYFDDHYDVYGDAVGRRYLADPADPIRGLLLPARVMDASQGFAAWSVDKREIQDELNQAGAGLEAWDIGRGKTLVMLYVADHREGDLGPYAEIMLGCLATQTREPLAVGLWILGNVPVSSPNVAIVGEQIWGHPKIPANVAFSYRARSVLCEWQGGGAETLLALELPRGGEGSSMSLPVLIYGRRRQYDGGPYGFYQTLITRSGTGEQLRGGGAGVRLSVPGREGLCDYLRRLGLVTTNGSLARPPLFTGWSEHVFGEASAPNLLIATSDPVYARPTKL
jgi:hypothetical protein